MAKLLVSMMPRSGRRYVEPFGGRGNVFWIAATELDFQEWHINDIRTAPWFAAIRAQGNDLIVPSNTRMEYLERWAAYKQGCPYATMLEPFLTYSGAGFGAGGYRSNEKGGSGSSGFRQSIRMAHHIMQAVNPLVTDRDYKHVLDGLGADDFVYLDPPYLDSRVTAYGPEDLDHTEMVSLLLTAKCRWMLSEYDQPIYRKAFGAPILKQPATTRHGKSRQECVWTSADFQRLQ
jgi:site-specific DNA-adenine methylase